MDIVEIREMLVRRHLILTYEEWYEINKNAFELVHNACLPCDLYQEYVEEEVQARVEIEQRKMRGGKQPPKKQTGDC